MTRPRLLDLFCGAGGAAMGYHRAGFDVVGVDIELQPRYPFEFHRADAMEVLASAAEISGSLVLWEWGVDAIHASPPCQDHSRSYKPRAHGTGWMLAATRELLLSSGLPYVIENVPGAPMRADYRLCGCMFGLPNLKRDRWFETSWHGFELRAPCLHLEPVMSVTGTSGGTRNEKRKFGYWPGRQDWQSAMGIDWMTMAEMAQAIPPAYTEYIGRQLLDHLTAEAAS